MNEAQRFSACASMALDAVGRKYPFYFPLYLDGPGDIGRPEDLFPAFHGAFDWHSCVHSHWCLVRILRVFPDFPQAAEARRWLAQNLTAEKLQGELSTLMLPQFKSFERPYGLAWVCQLAADLHLWRDPPDPALQTVCMPLAEEAAKRILAWHQRLPYPIQSGEHSQSALAMGLVRDFATILGRKDLETALDEEIHRLYAQKGQGILHTEPSGHDFLSPTLARADLVARVMKAEDFASWLLEFLPELPTSGLEPARGFDPADGKLAHLIGLNLSRAWMLKRIFLHLPEADSRQAVLRDMAGEHREAGYGAISKEHFESSHWLASFAVYEMTLG